jgi:hypothetical protein
MFSLLSFYSLLSLFSFSSSSSLLPAPIDDLQSLIQYQNTEGHFSPSLGLATILGLKEEILTTTQIPGSEEIIPGDIFTTAVVSPLSFSTFLLVFLVLLLFVYFSDFLFRTGKLTTSPLLFLFFSFSPCYRFWFI